MISSWDADVIQLRDKLTGSLIGLARATDGNAHMITDTTNAAMTEALGAAHGGARQDATALSALMEKVAAEKQKLVPDCALCAMPCGRTADYDMQGLQEAQESVRLLKFRILSAAGALADSGRASAFYDLLYKALFSVGMEDWGEEELLPILQEVEDAISK